MRFFICLALTATFTASAVTAPPSQNKTPNLDKICLAQKKPRALCTCISRNVARKVHNKDYSDEQFATLVLVMQERKPAGEENALDYDTMADFLTGLEYHCQENPKYSVE